MEEEKPVEQKKPENIVKEKTLNVNRPEAIKNEQRKGRRGLVFIIGLLCIAAIIIFIFISVFSSNRPQESKTDSSEKISTELDRTKLLQIVSEAVNYVESQRRQDGFYEYLYKYDDQCDFKNEVRVCPFGGERWYPTTNTWGALAHFGAYKGLKDDNELIKAKRDITKLSEWCAQDRSKCVGVLAEPIHIYEDTKDPEILKFLKAQIPALKNTSTSNDFMIQSIVTRELALLYEVTNDSTLLTEASSRMTFVQSLLSKQNDLFPNNNTRFAQKSCWFALANIAIGRAKQDKQIYYDTEAFLNAAKPIENFAGFINPVEIQPCIESYLELYEATGNTSDLTTAKKLTSLFIENYFDGSTQKIAYGKGATLFFAKDFNGHNVKKTITSLTDSSYTVYILSKLINEKEN